MSYIHQNAGWLLEPDSPGAPSVLDHPISPIEPVEPPANEIRAAHVRAVTLINQSFSQLQAALESPDATINAVRTKFWAIAFCLGLNLVGTASLSAKARELGCTKQLLSRFATDFSQAAGVAPSFYLKSASSRRKYALSRRQFVARSNGNGSNGNGQHPPT
jgi:hypothetical protein